MPLTMLTDADVQTIRVLGKGRSVPRAEIADRYGISQSYVSQIVWGRARADVPVTEAERQAELAYHKAVRAAQKVTQALAAELDNR
jgi:hypothetical protein